MAPHERIVLGIRGEQRGQALQRGAPVPGYGPVSYTHLDVYKRQREADEQRARHEQAGHAHPGSERAGKGRRTCQRGERRRKMCIRDSDHTMRVASA